jgi:uncharacterized protein
MNRFICFFLGVFILFQGNFSAYATPVIPSPPSTYFVDEEGVAHKNTVAALNTLFAMQNRESGEQIVFAIFKSLQGQDLVDWTNRIFQSWKIGQKDKNNGVLLALYWQDHEVRLEVGYGLEPTLTDAQSKLILAEELVPQIKSGNLDLGLRLTALKILSSLQSPLLSDGRAQKILEIEKYPTQPQRNINTPMGHMPPFVFLIFLVIIFIWIVMNLFFRRGFRRSSTNPFWRSRGPDDWGGGGSGGSDGFSGGGGSSGGGGASDRW